MITIMSGMACNLCRKIKRVIELSDQKGNVSHQICEECLEGMLEKKKKKGKK